MKKILIILTVILYLPIIAWCKTSGNMQFSYTDTQGNTESQLISIDGVLNLIGKGESQKIKAGLMYREESEQRKGESWYANIKDRHNLDDIFYWFNLTGIETDEYAGYDLRLKGYLGAGFELKESGHKFNAEFSPGLVYEDRADNTGYGYIACRGWERYEFAYEDFKIFEEAEYLYDYDSPEAYRVNGEVGLSSALTERLSLKVGPIIHYVNKPIGGRERTDIITKATIIVRF